MKYSVILVPPAGDPRKLLRFGPCGFCPPTMDRWRCVKCGAEQWYYPPTYRDTAVPSCSECGANGLFDSDELGSALVLGWKGELLDVGIGIAKSSSTVHQHARRIVRDWMAGNYSRKLVIGERATALVVDELGHVVERVEAAKGSVVATVPVLAMRELARGT